MAAEAARVGFDQRFLTRPLNVDLSGGERKRNETVQLGVLRPRFAILDEIDSGLDVDALRAVARRVEAATTETGLGVLAITHYNRLLSVLHPDHAHVLSKGRSWRAADRSWPRSSSGPATPGGPRSRRTRPAAALGRTRGQVRTDGPSGRQIDDPFGGPGAAATRLRIPSAEPSCPCRPLPARSTAHRPAPGPGRPPIAHADRPAPGAPPAPASADAALAPVGAPLPTAVLLPPTGRTTAAC